MKKLDNKWFVLVILMIFISVFSWLLFIFVWKYLSTNNNLFKTEKRLQAMNYAVEWLELTRWYFMTKQSEDRVSSWNNIISPLAWNYIISYNWGWYQIIPAEKEVIEVDEPYVVDYNRVITISPWDNLNEKKITVSVDYGEKNNVSFETTLVNLYWD